MTQTTTIANAQLILPDEVVTGSIVMTDGKITDMDQGTAVPVGAIDCGGDYVAPGLVELHTDNLERHLKPRPQVSWPQEAAVAAHDRELAGTGITTVFDAIRVGSFVDEKHKYGKYARSVADVILRMRAEGALRISHHLHLRAEVCSETLLDELAEFTPEDRVGIVSLMDHTPGQRQFTDVSKYKEYVMGKHGFGEAGFAEHVAYLEGLQARVGADHEAGTVAHAVRLGATLASHDDTTAAQVATSAAHGVKVAEFPTTMEAAEACRASGIEVIMGAPNVVRGGSHSGNVAAHELADAGLLDILSSDYVPAGLLMAAVQLGERWGSMAKGLATVTRTPAFSVGLTDRGVLAEGQRADVIRFAVSGGLPLLSGVWVGR